MIVSSNQTATIAFIDSQIDNYAVLIAGIQPKTQVVILDSTTNGIVKITDTLQQGQYTAVHLIAHGSPGCLYLGNSQLNLDTLNKYQQELKSWFCDPDTSSLLIYGCEVAAGDAGGEFISRLQQLTGAKIAATKTLTGNKDLGGNWELETTTTEMIVNLAIAESTRLTYQGILADFIVTTADDEDDGDVDGDDLSLREAIVAANNTSGTDTITFDSNISHINLTQGTLSITDGLDIKGLGSDALTIDGGNQNFAVFTIGDQNLLTPTFTVAMDGVTITGGNSSESGGGILNLENLKISNSVVSGNTTAKDGGGIFNLIGTAEIINTVISNNTATYGGGVSNYLGSTILNQSTISGNTAIKNGGGLDNYAGAAVALYSRIEDNSANNGGAIGNHTGAIAVVYSVVSGNTANGNGGGIYNENGEATITLSYINNNSSNFGGGIASQKENSATVISNSVVSGNTANFGGGVSNYQGNVNISASTVSGNSATDEGGGVSTFFGESNIINSTISGNWANKGGGVSNLNGQTVILSSTLTNNSAFSGSGVISYYATTVLASSIIAGNNNSSDVAGQFFITAGNNLIGEYPSGTLRDRGEVINLVNGENGDLVGTTDNPIDPKLGELQDNGGFTPTHALLPGSPAIDAGGDYGIVGDQRGGNFVRPVGLGNDIGAFELQNPISTRKNDFLVGGSNNNEIQGLAGNDTIIGLDGNDTLKGNAGHDTIDGGNNDDLINGGVGQDLLQGDQGNDLLKGGAGNDTVIGGAGDDTLKGGKGQDLLVGEDGNDSLKGGRGHDTLLGARGQDTLQGYKGDDVIEGGEDADKLYGQNGNDILNGGLGNDTIIGGTGNDAIVGAEGTDVLRGGAGQDVFFLDSYGENDLIVDFTDGVDKFNLTGELDFNRLTIDDNHDHTAAIIYDTSDNYEIVATVKGIQATELTIQDFLNT
jgi:Ca2+-binding RTX toxin-like protein